MNVRKPSEDKIEIFSRAVVEGNTQSDAWRLINPNSKASKKCVNEKASTYASGEKVKQRIAELRLEAKKAFTVSIEEKKEALWEIVQFGKGAELKGTDNVIEKQRNPAAGVAAIKELNLMDGDHAAQKVEHDISPFMKAESKARLMEKHDLIKVRDLIASGVSFVDAVNGVGE